MTEEVWYSYTEHEPGGGWKWRVWTEKTVHGRDGRKVYRDGIAHGYAWTRWGAKRQVRAAVRKAERHERMEAVELVIPKQAQETSE